MADPVLTATLSGQKAILLSWTFDSSADFQVFWKSSVPAGQEMVLLASTNAFSYTTPDLDPSKTYTFYVRANVGATYYYSNVVELFVSCGKGVVLSGDPPDSPEAQGILIVTDTGNNRIVKLFRNLTWIATAGSAGSGNENYNTPSQSCIFGGYVYTADTGNHRIVKRLLADLSYVGQSGSFGTGNGQFDSPEGVCSDGSFLYVADTGNSRIVKMTLVGMTYLSSFGHLNDILHRVRISESGGEHQGDPIAAGPGEVNYSGGISPFADPATVLNRGVPYGGTEWRRGVFYSSEGGGYANNVAKQYGTGTETTPPTVWTTYQGYGAGGWSGARSVVTAGLGGYVWVGVGVPDPIKALHLDRPKGLVSDGVNLFVSDYNHNGVIAIKLSDLTYVARYGNAQGGDSDYPAGCEDSSGITIYFGKIFITSESNVTYPRFIKLVSPGLTPESSFGPVRDTIPGRLAQPSGIWALKGSLYSTELLNHRIQRWSVTDYSFISHLGGTGSGSGENQFNAPRGITGNLWTP